MRFEIKILLAASVFYNLAAGLLGPIYAIYVQQIGGDTLAASGAWTIFSFVAGALILLFGTLEDHRLNQKSMIVIGYGIIAFANIGYLFLTNVFELFLVQAVLGVGVAVLTPAWDAIYSTHLDKGKESSEWSYWDGGTRILYSASALTGGIVVTLYGFKALFVMMSVFGFCAAISSAFLLKDRDFKKSVKRRHS